MEINPTILKYHRRLILKLKSLSSGLCYSKNLYLLKEYYSDNLTVSKLRVINGKIISSIVHLVHKLPYFEHWFVLGEKLTLSGRNVSWQRWEIYFHGVEAS